jgi:hypothetical protein
LRRRATSSAASDCHPIAFKTILRTMLQFGQFTI